MAPHNSIDAFPSRLRHFAVYKGVSRPWRPPTGKNTFGQDKGVREAAFEACVSWFLLRLKSVYEVCVFFPFDHAISVCVKLAGKGPQVFQGYVFWKELVVVDSKDKFTHINRAV